MRTLTPPFNRGKLAAPLLVVLLVLVAACGGQAAESSGPAASERGVGDVDGITFVVSEGSEATFTVREQLIRIPLPNDAVVRTTGLSGEVHLDGRASNVVIDLLSMTSNSSFRDRYVRDRLFRGLAPATVTFSDLRPLPDGFGDGVAVTTVRTGQLTMNGVQVQMAFEIEARDDGDVIFIVGRSSFTWADIGMTAPRAIAVVSVEDEVRVEVLLALRPSEL